MDSFELQNLMQQQMSAMPTKARRVVEYLLGHMREAAFRSIGEVAGDLEVSKAQLVRVARMLGFSGYAELKEALQGAILEEVNPAAMLEKSRNAGDEIADRIYRTEHANLDDTWKQLRPADIATFCGLVEKANNIYCLGWGISSLVAESLFMRLRVMGLQGFLMKRGHMTLTEQARAVAPRDLLIVCEMPSYVVEVTETVTACHDRGVQVVTVTDSPAAPVCKAGTLDFFVSAASPTFGSSILGPLFLVHILTSSLAIAMGDKAGKALGEQAEFLHDTRIFHPVFGLQY